MIILNERAEFCGLMINIVSTNMRSCASRHYLQTEYIVYACVALLNCIALSDDESFVLYISLRNVFPAKSNLQLQERRIAARIQINDEREIHRSRKGNIINRSAI